MQRMALILVFWFVGLTAVLAQNQVTVIGLTIACG